MSCPCHLLLADLGAVSVTTAYTSDQCAKIGELRPQNFSFIDNWSGLSGYISLSQILPPVYHFRSREGVVGFEYDFNIEFSTYLKDYRFL